MVSPRLRDDPWFYLTIMGWTALLVVVVVGYLPRYVQFLLWGLALSCFGTALIIASRRIWSVHWILKRYKALEAALDTYDPDKIMGANLLAQADASFMADPHRQAIVAHGIAIADQLRKEAKK